MINRMIINFIKRENTQYKILNQYCFVVQSFIDSIRKFLPPDSYIISENAKEGMLNVDFFNDSDKDKSSLSFVLDVFICHGLADKGYTEACFLKNFKNIIVSGPFFFNKLVEQGRDPNSLFIGGYPKLDALFELRKTLKSQNSNTLNILYAPTHTNSGVLTILPFYEEVKEHLKDFNVILTEHPYDKKSHMPTFSELINADIVIADIGSLVYEAFSLDIPVIMLDWKLKELVLQKTSPKRLEYRLYNERIGYHANSITELKDLVLYAHKHGIDPKTKDFMEEVFPSSLRGKSGQTIAQYLLKLANDGY